MKFKIGDKVISIQHENITNICHVPYIGKQCTVSRIFNDTQIETTYDDEKKLVWVEYMLKKVYNQIEQIADLEKVL